MTIEEIKELAIIETKGHWEIEDIFENTRYYIVCFKGKGEMSVGVPIIKINKRTKKFEFILGCDIPDDIKQIA